MNTDILRKVDLNELVFSQNNFNQSTPVCENPKIIVRPDIALSLSCAISLHTIKGFTEFSARSFSSFKELQRRVYPFYQALKDKVVTLDNIKDWFLVDNSSCVSYIYQVVPCGHCSACQERKKFSFSQMCEFETLSHDFCPWFGTLTYDNSHLPYTRKYDSDFVFNFGSQFSTPVSYNDACKLLDNFDKSELPPDKVEFVPTLCNRDVQLFLKRFRQNLKRKHDGKYNFPLRYVVVGEYGRQSCRPHYHFIFWNLHAHNRQEYDDIHELIRISWKNGFVQSRLIDVSKNDKCFEYTAKYVGKGESKSIRMQSVKNGGIGKPYLINQFSGYLQKSLNATPLYYYNKFNANIKEVVFTSRVQSILCPTISRLVPPRIRQSFICLNRYKGDSFVDSILDIANDFFYIPSPQFSFLNDDLNKNFPDKDTCLYVLFNWKPVREFIDNIQPLDALRSVLEDLFYSSVRSNSFLISKFSSLKDIQRGQRLSELALKHQRFESRLNQYSNIYDNIY